MHANMMVLSSFSQAKKNKSCCCILQYAGGAAAQLIEAGTKNICVLEMSLRFSIGSKAFSDWRRLS